MAESSSKTVGCGRLLCAEQTTSSRCGPVGESTRRGGTRWHLSSTETAHLAELTSAEATRRCTGHEARFTHLAHGRLLALCHLGCLQLLLGEDFIDEFAGFICDVC